MSRGGLHVHFPVAEHVGSFHVLFGHSCAFLGEMAYQVLLNWGVFFVA